MLNNLDAKANVKGNANAKANGDTNHKGKTISGTLICTTFWFHQKQNSLLSSVKSKGKSAILRLFLRQGKKFFGKYNRIEYPAIN